MRLIRWFVWGSLALVGASLVFVSLTLLERRNHRPLPIYADVTDFHLTNQLGQAVSLSNLTGRAWVADIIFTRCPGPCLLMSKKMQAIQESVSTNAPVRFVSLTADPKFDTPPVLKTYGDRFKADPQRWQFLTGPKKDGYDLAIKGLKLAVQDNAQSTSIDDEFVHSTRFVLIDSHGRLRAVSPDGTDASAVPALLRSIRQLLKEG